MKAMQSLPEGYREIYTIDLQKDIKMAVIINGLALLIAAALVLPMHFVIPVTILFDMSAGLLAYSVRILVLLGLLVLYMVLHELVHGVAMKLCGTKKIKYGFTGLYAFAGSDDYYDKRSYILIALAPVVLWGVVLAAINPFIPEQWFWVVYLIQVNNLSGAAGDLFVTVRFSRMPKDILIRDHGVGMRVYSKQ